MNKSRTTLRFAELKRQQVGLPVVPEHPRPATRGECASTPRPCPYVGCRYHLFLEPTPAGSLRLPFGEDVEALETMDETCALDVADRSDHDMTQLAHYMGVTGSRIQQELPRALGKLRALAQEEGLTMQDLLGAEAPPGREAEPLSLSEQGAYAHEGS